MQSASWKSAYADMKSTVRQLKLSYGSSGDKAGGSRTGSEPSRVSSAMMANLTLIQATRYSSGMCTFYLHQGWSEPGLRRLRPAHQTALCLSQRVQECLAAEGAYVQDRSPRHRNLELRYQPSQAC